MEKHRCKLCSRAFSNGRALGGHMKAHLAILPLPPKKQTTKQKLTESPSSSSSPSSSEEDESRETVEKNLVYRLREKPRKSFKFTDHEFSNSGSVSVSVLVTAKDGGDSETESRNPVRRRSERVRKPSLAESEPASSVSDGSAEEDIAMCLIMLSKDTWDSTENEESVKITKKLRSFREIDEEEDEEDGVAENEVKEKIFECPFCSKVFESGQALGGHKRVHLLNNASSSSSSSATAINASAKAQKTIWLDLNLPAPAEEDEHSVVSAPINA